MDNVINLPGKTPEPLQCSGIGRDAEAPRVLCLYFTRPPTDHEMHFLHEVMIRAAVNIPDPNDGDPA